MHGAHVPPSANCASDVRGAPFMPASCASLIAFASREYPTGPCASTIRCSPAGSGIPNGGRRATDRELGAEHRREIDRASGFGEAHHAVEAVVIGEIASPANPRRAAFLDELLGMARTVEEREVRVTVQLGVLDPRSSPLLHRTDHTEHTFDRAKVGDAASRTYQGPRSGAADRPSSHSTSARWLARPARPASLRRSSPSTYTSDQSAAVYDTSRSTW